jgi:hypothetical protein
MLTREAARHRLGGWSLWARTFEHALGRGDRMALDPSLMPNHAAMVGTIDPWLVDLDTLARAEAGGLAWCAPEILRARAVQLLKLGDAASDEAASALLTRAIELASAQGALAWELRAATTLASLRHKQGRGADARAIAERVYSRFTEGFDTADLVAARAVLDALEGAA